MLPLLDPDDGPQQKACAQATEINAEAAKNKCRSMTVHDDEICKGGMGGIIVAGAMLAKPNTLNRCLMLSMLDASVAHQLTKAHFHGHECGLQFRLSYHHETKLVSVQTLL